MGSNTVEVFPFRFDPWHRLPALPFGIAPPTAWVRVSAQGFEVRFGPWCLRSPRVNIAGTTITGPYWWLKTAGPAHVSLADQGLTCATNGERGLCVRFTEPVRGIEPFGLLRHPAVTVTVDDCERLARLLSGPPSRVTPASRPNPAPRPDSASRPNPVPRSARPSGRRHRG